MKISDESLPDEEIKALKNLIVNKDSVIQKADKDNTIVVLNKNDNISKFNRILDDTSKFKRLQLEEGKVLNHIIYMEQCIVDLLKSLKNQNEISEKNHDNFYPSGSKAGILYGLGKISKTWKRMEFQLFVQFCMR